MSYGTSFNMQRARQHVDQDRGTQTKIQIWRGRMRKGKSRKRGEVGEGEMGEMARGEDEQRGSGRARESNVIYANR